MKGLTETDFKYLAGLIDADGWISFNYCKSVSTNNTYLQLRIGVAASDNIDRDGLLISWISSHLGCYSKSVDVRGTIIHLWQVSKRSELNSFVPRLLKHMIIKGKHLDRLYTAYTELKGEALSDNTIETLKALSLESRKDSGPVKSKNYPTKAWVAGYLDGDGHYGLHKRKKDGYTSLSIQVLSDKKDDIGLTLLKKTYGGTINCHQSNNHNPKWYRGLGKQHRAFAISFLKTMHRHSRLKKHKIEQMLSFHNYSCND